MFAPFLVTPGLESKVFGLFLFVTGPYMSVSRHSSQHTTHT